MKQFKTIFTAICLLVFFSVPMTVLAAPEPEPATWTENMDGRPAADGQEAENAAYEKKEETRQDAGADQEADAKKDTEPKRDIEPEQTEEKPQDTLKNGGTLRIWNAAAGTGERLTGAVFAVYQKDGAKTGELTLQEGAASLSLPVGDYYLKQLKAPSGYGAEPARIVFSILKGETTLAEVTSEIDLTNVNPQDIIPKTGQTPPAGVYVLSMLCFAAAFFCGFKLWRMEAGEQKKGGVHAWQSWF